MELNTEQLMRIFGVTLMTVYNWRYPHPNGKKSVIPYHRKKSGDRRRRIYFKWVEVKKWAKENNVEVVVHPKVLLQQGKVL
jgi:hypothetical protein